MRSSARGDVNGLVGLKRVFPDLVMREVVDGRVVFQIIDVKARLDGRRLGVSVSGVQSSPLHLRKDRVRDAFSGAADYNRHARVQRRAAERLADRIGALGLPEDATICELGCGTGFLGSALGRRLPDAKWLATDLSPQMVQRAEAALGADRRFNFAVVDAENPEPLNGVGPFDLICSNFAAQWFSDLEEVLTALVRHLKPRGRILITTLASGSFAEWRRAHVELGLAPGVPAYPSAEALQRLRPAGLIPTIEIYEDVDIFASGVAFLHALRSIGATTPLEGHVALGAGEIRRVLRRFEQGDRAITYEIASLELRASGRGQ